MGGGSFSEKDGGEGGLVSKLKDLEVEVTETVDSNWGRCAACTCQPLQGSLLAGI